MKCLMVIVNFYVFIYMHLCYLFLYELPRNDMNILLNYCLKFVEYKLAKVH